MTPTHHITRGFTSGFYTGGTGGVSAEDVPGKWDVSLAGRHYMLDDRNEAWGEKSVPLLKPQQDSSNTPSRASVNPEGQWLSGQDSWHHGSGQRQLDGPEADPFRYGSSKGVDPWTRNQFSLLPDTDQKRWSTNTNLNLTVAGTRLYMSDGRTLHHTSDPSIDNPVWTTVTGTDASTLNAITSDGFYIYGAWANGIGRTSTATSAITDAWSALVASELAFVKGRLMAAGSGGSKHILYNVVAAGAAPAALFTHPSTNWTWVDFAAGHNCIYAAGYSGDKSLIYRTAVVEDGTSLDTPVIAGELPDGEVVRSIAGYLGFIVIGTDRGVRFAMPGGDGDLTLGALLVTDAPCRAFEGQEQFVWFGWDNFDSTSTGMGRLSLEEFSGTDNLAPAFASDLMATGVGSVESIATFDDRRYFTVHQSTYSAYLNLTGASGSYASTPDHADYAVTDLDIRVKFRASALTGSQVLASQYHSAVSDNRGWILELESTGALRLFWSTDGSLAGQTFVDSTAGAITAATDWWARVTLDVVNGANKTYTFYKSTDATNDPDAVSWTTINTASPAGNTSIFNSTTPPELGTINGGTASRYTGRIYVAALYSAIGGTKVFHFDANRFPDGATSGVGDMGRLWTIHSPASIVGTGNSTGGLHGQDTDLVASGTITSGRVTSGLPENKTALAVNVRHREIEAGSTTVALSTNGAAYEVLGGALTADGSVPASEVGREFELQFTLASGGDDEGPALSSWTLRLSPAVTRTRFIVAPLVLQKTIETRDGKTETMNPTFEREVLIAYFDAGSIVTYQEAQTSYAVVIDNFEFQKHHLSERRNHVEGTFVATLKAI